MKDFFVHESSYIDEGAVIGARTKIWHFCHVMPRARIGEDCSLGQNVCVASDVEIGSNVRIQNNVSIYTGVRIEDDVFLGPSMVFTNVLNPRSHVSRKHEYRQTIVKKGASIGANATIVCGVTIGQYAFVGAGAVVTADIPDYALVHGAPARIRGWMCQCGIKLRWIAEARTAMAATHGDVSPVLRLITHCERATCTDCGTEYVKHAHTVRVDGAVEPEFAAASANSN